jgi:hypothetical protein
MIVGGLAGLGLAWTGHPVLAFVCFVAALLAEA